MPHKTQIERKLKKFAKIPQNQQMLGFVMIPTTVL